MNSANQTVLITGASGQLGAAVVQRFRRDGARLVLLARHAPEGSANDAGQQVVQADLLARDVLIQKVADIVQAVGRIDVLCHLAGGFHMGEPVHATPMQAWDAMMDLNARALLNIAAAVVPHMLEQGRGRIVTVGALGALRGGAHMGAYAASKSALMRLTESMSLELRDQGIAVNGVMPSTLDTPANRAAMPEADPTRWVEPEALADVIAFLASDAARAIHGAMIPVAGRV